MIRHDRFRKRFVCGPIEALTNLNYCWHMCYDSASVLFAAPLKLLLTTEMPKMKVDSASVLFAAPLKPLTTDDDHVDEGNSASVLFAAPLKL